MTRDDCGIMVGDIVEFDSDKTTGKVISIDTNFIDITGTITIEVMWDDIEYNINGGYNIHFPYELNIVKTIEEIYEESNVGC